MAESGSDDLDPTITSQSVEGNYSCQPECWKVSSQLFVMVRHGAKGGLGVTVVHSATVGLGVTVGHGATGGLGVTVKHRVTRSGTGLWLSTGSWSGT